MGNDPKIKVRFSAFDVAMQAKAGGLTPEDVGNVVVLAEELLGSGDAMTRAVNQFATQYELVRHDVAGLAAIGDALLRQIELLNVPEPPDMGRRDIHG